MAKLPSLILASVSPRRSELLRQLGLEFRVVPSEAPETDNRQLSPFELVQMNAHRKARPVALQFPNALVLGADTVVCLGSTILGKPAHLEDAFRMLKQLQGHTHQVVTGVCLMHRKRRRTCIFAVSTQVAFRPLTAAQIRGYCQVVNPLDKAGAYAIQEAGNLIIDHIDGSFSNVVGLPTERLQEELQLFA
jgi:septum formation protein